MINPMEEAPYKMKSPGTRGACKVWEMTVSGKTVVCHIVPGEEGVISHGVVGWVGWGVCLPQQVQNPNMPTSHKFILHS